jgi:biopolymer transport protein ExbB
MVLAVAVALGCGLAGAARAQEPEVAAVGEDAPRRAEPTASWAVRNGIGLAILAMSAHMVALVVWMWRNYRPERAMPEGLTRDLEHRLQARRYSEAYERLLVDRSMLARVLAAGVRRLPAGQPAAVRAMELANEQATLEMEQRASYLATVATLGPMIGLLGTVFGMIVSFGVLARAGAAPQAGDLAAGISTALLATLEGIAVAVPAIVFHAVFRNRIDRLSADVQAAAEERLDAFAAGVRSPHPLAAAALTGAGLDVPGRSALP